MRLFAASNLLLASVKAVWPWEEGPTQTDIPGYLPCPDTHPWEYEYDDFQMCCDDEPITSYDQMVCDSLGGALYRDEEKHVGTSGKIELNKYKDGANHAWNIDSDCSSVDVDVTKMHTEENYDYLFINNDKFSGEDPFKLTDLPSSFEIAFTSDAEYSDYDGFTLYWSCSKETSVSCPASHPFAYDYYGTNDYCCAHDPAQNPDSDYCVDDNDQMLGVGCEHEPPCDNHPSVVDDVKAARGSCPESHPYSVSFYSYNDFGSHCCSEVSDVMETEYEFFPCDWGTFIECESEAGCDDHSGADVAKKNVVFKRPDGSSVLYHRTPVPRKWVNAQAYCESQGGSLAIPLSQEENDFLADLGTTHLGWSNGVEGAQAQSFQNWGPDNPASTGPDTYVHLIAGSSDDVDFSGKWMSCGSIRGFKEFPQTCNIKECAAGTKFDETNENCIEEEPAEQTCPENMPFNFLDGYMCCEHQEDADDNCPEGAQGSNCNTHHPDTGIYTCADHPTAVRKEASDSKCPACWTENDEGVCEFDTSAADCFTQTCNNGAMQLSINFENLFNSNAADLGEYNQELGVDNENWPSQTIEFTEDSIVLKLKVTSDDLNDSAVSCGAKKTVQGVDIVVEAGSGPCLEVNFICSFPREVELSSDGFVVENPMSVGVTTDENGPPTIQGNIKDSFKPMVMVNEDGDAVTDDNVKLGSKILVTLESTLASDRLGLFAKDCSISEGEKSISIIKNGCYSAAVGASFGDNYVSSGLKANFEWSTFVIGNFQKTTSTQILTCTARICDQTSCKSEVDALTCPVDASLSYVHAKVILSSRLPQNLNVGFLEKNPLSLIP